MKKISKRIAPTSTSVFTLNGIQYDNAAAMVNSFLQNKGSYNTDSPTCIWFSQPVFNKMNSIVQNLAGSDGIRFYFAKTIPNGDYTVIAVTTLDGGPDPTDPTTGPTQRHIHNDYFLHYNPNPTGAVLYGKLGDVTPIRGALLYRPTSSPSPCPPGGDDCPDAPHYITCSKAYKMVNNFSSDEINATSEWFDKGIINSLNATIPIGGGIRVYFARRLDVASQDTITRHGFVIILTGPNPDDSSIQQDTFVCISLENITHYPFKYDLLRGGGTDNGEQCPTNCTGITWP